MLRRSRRASPLSALLLLIGLVASGPTTHAAENDPPPDSGRLIEGRPGGEGWVSILPEAGDHFAGWNAEPEYWRVEDGVLHGESTGDARHHHAFTEKHYRDFELHAVIRMRGEGANSGVCIRLQATDPDNAPGYQVDMGPGYWGCLWEERRAGMVAKFPEAKADQLVKAGDWNHYYIVARGHRIQAWLNGVQTIDVVHESGHREGAIGFQLCHGKKHTIVDVKTLAIRELASDPPRHSFFVAGPSFTGILGEDGEEQWSSGRGAARDGFVLANGHVLIAWGDEVLEKTREGEVVFRYRKSKENREIGTCARLENGNTLITELGARPRLLEVSPEGEIVVDCPLEPETDNAHMQTRMARKLSNGNYLVPHLLAFRVKEYTPDGKVVKSFATDLEELGGRAAENWPFTAIRLENGNTLVSLTHGNKVVELDADGSVVWKLTNDDLPGAPLVDPCGAQRLATGNTVIASYGAKDGIKLLEVTREKKIVWTYEGPHRAHHFQVLTTDGTTIAGPVRK